MKKHYLIFNLILILSFFGAIFLQTNPLPVYASEKSSQINFTNLIVFAKFKDEEEFVYNSIGGTTVKQLIDNSYSNSTYSVKDYFNKVSNGKINMQNVYLLDKDGGSLTLENKRGYYYENKDGNQIGYTSDQYEFRLNELKHDWSNAIQTALENDCKISDVNQSQKFTIDDLDKNNDGNIDSITIIYKYSTDFSGAWKGCLWNYQSYCDMVNLNGSSGKITSKAYVQQTYDYRYCYSTTSSAKFGNLKTMIHEMGHIFGLKDLYNASSNSPVWYMSAMSNAISPVPQYISAKEREVLGWLNEGNVQTITSQGQYTIKVTSSEPTNDVICYKLKIPSTNKILYLEYRKFNGTTNKYDTQEKTLYDTNGAPLKTITIKSGLVCFLINANTTFPNNLNSTKNNWDYEVLGGQYSTKSDSALAAGESLQITSNLSVEVLTLTNDELTFKISGTDISSAHTHSLTKVDFKDSTCSSLGNIEYYKCSSCNKYFLSDNSEISYSETIIALKGHSPALVSGTPATCKKEGLTDGSACSNCNKVLQPQTVIPKIDHTESEWILDKDSTTTETGNKHKECTSCHEILKTEVVPIKETPSKGSSPKTLYIVIGVGGSIALVASIAGITIPIVKKKRRRW